MKRACLHLLSVFCTVFLCGCQDDSDYVVGKYAVTITTELSSCDENFFVVPNPAHLPTSTVVGHQSQAVWRMTRMGITGTGAEKIHLDILSEETNDVALRLTGTREQAWLHSETLNPFTVEGCNLQRLIILSGQYGADNVTGVIRTTLVFDQPSGACAFPAPFQCDVTESFIAIQDSSD